MPKWIRNLLPTRHDMLAAITIQLGWEVARSWIKRKRTKAEPQPDNITTIPPREVEESLQEFIRRADQKVGTTGVVQWTESVRKRMAQKIRPTQEGE